MKFFSAVLCALCATLSLPTIAADAVYVNGQVYAGIVKNPWATAIAVDGERISYIGNDPSDHIESHTRVYNLDGKLVIPGLIDSHAHPGFVATTVNQFTLDDTDNLDDLLAAIQTTIRELDDRDVLIGGFWANDIFPVTGPRKEMLDAIESKRPLILYDSWAHTVWANSAALRVAGVTRDTEDLVPGFSFFQKDSDGEPTGWITESAASVFINHFLTVSDDVEAALSEYLDYYRALGVTTILDAGNFGRDREIYTAVKKLENQGKLPVRYHGSFTLFNPHDYDTAIDELKALAAEFDSDLMHIDTLKIFYDGIIETRTAAVAADYLDTPGNSGEVLLTVQQVHDLIVDLDKENLNLHMHSVGNRATTNLLDAVAAAHTTLGRPHRNRISICHLEMVDNEDLRRFRELGVVANFTPHWFVGGDLSWSEAGVGNAAQHMQRPHVLINDGARVTFSSDITDYGELTAGRANPYLGMQMAHNRQDVGVEPDGEFFPPLGERVDIDDAIHAYSSNAAYALGRDNEFGILAAGLLADFVVLDQNIFEADRYDIHKTKPIAIVIEGQLVEGELQQFSR